MNQSVRTNVERLYTCMCNDVSVERLDCRVLVQLITHASCPCYLVRILFKSIVPHAVLAQGWHALQSGVDWTCVSCRPATMPVNRHWKWWEGFDTGEGDEAEMVESDDEDDPSQEFAAEMLVELLLWLKLSGLLPARYICIIAWWAWKSGSIGGG